MSELIVTKWSCCYRQTFSVGHSTLEWCMHQITRHPSWVSTEQANRKCHTASNGCRVLQRMAFPSRRHRTVHKNYYLTQIVAFTRTVARVGRVARMARNEIGWLTMWTVLLRSWPGSVSLHPRLLPDRATSLSEGRMRRRLRRGAGVLRHTSGCYCRLLLRRISRQKTRQSRTTGWWSAGM